MSLFPLHISDGWHNPEQSHRPHNQNIGFLINSENISALEPAQLKFNPGGGHLRFMTYYHPLGELMHKGEVGASTVKADKDKFQMILDVQQFAPEEINVKVVDRYVVVEGKHEEKQDEHGWISRQFARRYVIPEQWDIDQVTSKLSTDGVLCISVPRKKKPAPENERIINIEYTNKPATRDQTGEKKAGKKKEES